MKADVLGITAYRPFPAQAIAEALGPGNRHLVVLERALAPGTGGLNTWYYADAPATVRPTLEAVRRVTTWARNPRIVALAIRCRIARSSAAPMVPSGGRDAPAMVRIVTRSSADAIVRSASSTGTSPPARPGGFPPDGQPG